MKEKKLKIIIISIAILLIIATTTILLLNHSKKNNTDIKPNNTQNNPKIDDNIIKDSDFELKFLKLESNKQNMIYSPLSIKYALAMLNEGANGNTKEQIKNVIGNQEITKYNNINNVLSLANAAFIRNSYKNVIKDDYKTLLSNKYNAEINYDPFNNATNINNWIKKKTFGKIKNMLNDNQVSDPDNIMLLINALAIDMEWITKFDEEDTGASTFYLEDGSNMQDAKMTLKTFGDNISYYKDKNITSLSMDLEKYNDTQLEFIAIMPNNNLKDYIKTFSINDFNKIIKKSTPASKTKNGVYISIPKFSFEYDLDFKNDLNKLGITDAFNNGVADFSLMSDKKLYVSDALHKANIDFTEKGIKAAAVTVIYMTTGVGPYEDEPIYIAIYKPFLYIIRDKNTNEIWFVGTVYKPNSWEDEKDNYKYE